ncbi:MAG: cytochrome c-type biogenesis CcmF C-terminal domain-containing protein [candidate division KSB1 bacterium]|nr:cytochrome c-type biogenesis CcmF C-terminal domain-containing protein [candidate division KSB1 bacterium]
MGLGPGGKRSLHALVNWHGISAFDYHPGKKGHAQNLEYRAHLFNVCAINFRDVPNPKRRYFIGAFVHTVVHRSALFLGFVVFILVSSFGFLFLRIDRLKSKARLESIVSRESAFLINNVVFVGACFAVFWGTVFPVVSEAVRGVKITVGPPFFNAVNVPIFLFLLFLTGVGPLVAWRKSSPQYLKRLFLWPTVAMVGTYIVLFAIGVRHQYALLSFALGVFVTATIVAEYHRGAMARMKNLARDTLAGLWSTSPEK